MAEHAASLSVAGHGLLHHVLWGLHEAVTSSQFVRKFLTEIPEAAMLLQQVMQSLLDDARGPPAADKANSEARRAFTEGFCTLTLLGGPSVAVAAMKQRPKSRAIMAAGCAALRDAAQKGMAEVQCAEVVASLKRACQVCVDDTEVETAANLALGLLGG